MSALRQTIKPSWWTVTVTFNISGNLRGFNDPRSLHSPISQSSESEVWESIELVQINRILSNSFWKFADADVDICTYFIPANCRDHQISPVMELTYYHVDSYYHDQTQTHSAFFFKCSHSQDKIRKLLKRLSLKRHFYLFRAVHSVSF